jgi:hypothetical protein
MSRRMVRTFVAVGALLATGAARADLVSVLQDVPIAAATAAAFHNVDVVPGTVSADGRYNFLDKWTFTLDGSFQVASIAASIAFTDEGGRAVLLGISNLQVNLVGEGVVLASWRTVSEPVSGLQQTVALIPSTALAAGDYTLQVRGYVVEPGAYAGSLVAQPVQVVPLPASSALFAAGLMALGFAAHRLRRR